jgi:putative nucleotidyltransferase with HDIG domain
MSAPDQGDLAAVSSAVESDAGACDSALAELLNSLQGALGAAWWLVDTVSASVTGGPNLPADRLPAHWLALCGEVARRGKTEFIGDDEPLLGLAVPISDIPNRGDGESRHVAVGLFLSTAALADRAAADRRAMAQFAHTFGWQTADAERWLAEQMPWSPERLLAVAELVLSRFAGSRRVDALRGEAARMSAHLTDLYEEISLWHRLTRHLRISENEEELGCTALEWLSAAVPAETLVLQLIRGTDSQGQKLCSSPVFLSRGSYFIEEQSFDRVIETLGLDREVQTVIVNPPGSAARLRDFADLRQLIIVPLAVGENLIGWLAAMNHREGEEFGSPEASLLASVAALLGIHAGNLALYRQQAEMLQGIVRALTSAIDAKDPYTCGHSDRVAQIAVALAGELGFDRKQLETLYLSGLLHDIGKIGIDDSVLRKPGKLSDAEYEHIKLHPEIGYRILRDLKQLGEVLPVVRHHHEAWNGHGYPFGLAGDEIPQMARIVAVADAFDAMSSDRPYRKGMSDQRLDGILRDGAGQQWDASVVDAFFRIREKIRKICGRDGNAEFSSEELCRLT